MPRLTQGDKAAFHAWANAKALADVRALEFLCHGLHEEPSPERPIPFDEYLRLLNVVTTRVAAGHFAYHEPGGIHRRGTLEGLAYLAFVAMRREDVSVTWAEVWQLATEHEELFRRAFDEANVDPNRPPPGTSRGAPTAGIGEPSMSCSSAAMG